VSATLVDARGLRCPWPVVRLARALREDGAPVTIVADDPLANTEIAAFATATGCSVILEETEIGTGWRVDR